MTTNEPDAAAVAAAPAKEADPMRRRRFATLPPLVRRLLVALALVAALPLVLVPVHALVRPVSTLMLWDLATFKGYSRTWVGFDAISPHLVRSVMMSEDGRFCEHGGVDWSALGLVLDQSDEDGPARGASTITMQTVKNLYLWPSRSYLRKGLELPLALYADLLWSKRRTLEIYLNIAEWGPNLYGAEAAARAYFGKPAAELTRREAALMAAALPNPIARNPARPTARQRGIARIVERRAAQSGAYVGCVFGG